MALVIIIPISRQSSLGTVLGRMNAMRTSGMHCLLSGRNAASNSHESIVQVHSRSASHWLSKSVCNWRNWCQSGSGIYSLLPSLHPILGASSNCICSWSVQQCCPWFLDTCHFLPLLISDGVCAGQLRGQWSMAQIPLPTHPPPCKPGMHYQEFGCQGW